MIDSQVRDVIINLELNSLSKSIVERTVKIVEKNKGKHSLILSVLDSEKNYKVDLLSRKIKVDINKDFIKEIDELNEVSLSVN